VNVPLTGSYNSAVARTLPLLSIPPVTSTFPLLSSVAVWAARRVLMLPVEEKLPVEGSNNCAVAWLPFGSENNVDLGDRQKLILTSGDPLIASSTLTLGTVSRQPLKEMAR